MNLRWTLVVFAIRVVFKLLYRFEIEGRNNVPQEGGLILASNHQSYLDPLVLASVLRRPIRFMAKQELFKIPVLRSLVRFFAAFPVRRDVVDRGAIKIALDCLAQGEVVGVFPEGTRHKEGRLGAGLPGVGLLALKSGVPVLPVVILGTEKVMPDGRRLPRFPRVKAVVGETFKVEATYGGRQDIDRARDEIMRHIATLKERRS